MKKLLAILLALVMVIAMVGCGAKEEAAAPEAAAPEAGAADYSGETYVYMCPLSSLEYWQFYRVGLEDACAELGVTAKFVGDDGFEADAMCAILETLINDPSTAGIITNGHFPEAYEPYFEQALAKGIGVIYSGGGCETPTCALTTLGSDYVAYGAQMFDQAAEAVGGKGKVIISQNLTGGGTPGEQVMQGIHEQVLKYPDMEIVAEVDDQSDAAVAASKIGAALLANPDTAVIIGCQSASGVGAVTAVKEAGMGDQVQIVCIDRDAATLEYIKNGDIYSTVAGKQYTEAYYGTKILFDYRHGSKAAFSNDDVTAGMVIAPQFIDTGALVINQDNVDYFLDFTYADQ